MPPIDDVNSALRVLISSQEQTHSCVKELSRDVKRNTALVVANGVRLNIVIEKTRENDDRLTGVELWIISPSLLPLRIPDAALYASLSA